MNQQKALEILKLGHNVYLTGPAGSGKTFLLNQYINYLKGNGIEVGITASTGIAATHLNGRTIHSWAGINIKEKLTNKDLLKILSRKNLQWQFLLTNVLIIDEVSMLHSFRLDMVDRVCKAFKGSDKSFGGMQVILCGDFFQLSPVCKNGEDPSFINTSRAWQDMNIQICHLDEQHRFTDQDYMCILNEIRANNTSESSLQLLINRFNKNVENHITPTKLCTHNADADAINDFKLAEIPSKEETYQMMSMGEPKLIEALKDGCLAPENLVLKKGAAVMFVKNNFGKGYVNGTLGKVVDFDDERYPIVETVKKQRIIARPESWKIEENNRTLALISQTPLRLAWAITVHKSQGMSLDAAEIDLSKTFEYGMGYVALSRVRSLAGLKLIGINDLALQVNKAAIELDGELKEKSQTSLAQLENLSYEEKSKRQNDFLDRLKVAPKIADYQNADNVDQVNIVQDDADELEDEVETDYSPKTIKEAIELINSTEAISDDDFRIIFEYRKNKMDWLHSNFGPTIRALTGLNKGNKALLEACGSKNLSPEEASRIIMEELWKDIHSR